MENNNDKLAQIINYLNSMEKELSERIGRIEKHLGLDKVVQPVKPEPIIKPVVPAVSPDIKVEEKPLAPKQEIIKPTELPKPKTVELPPNLLGIAPPIAPAKEKPVVPEVPKEPPKKSRTSAEWEALIGGKWLNRIGAIALIIGMGFFLKYAVDQNWITPVMRVLIGVATGMTLIGGGMYYHKKRFKIFSQGLLGAGISVLYLSVFASFSPYKLLPQIPAFGLMSVVTVISFLLATKYNSLAVALLGWTGGFLTPIILSTGHANEIGLFTYIALLNIGILAMTVKKDKWVILEPLTLFGTYLMYFAWYAKFYETDNLAITILFASIFWVLFYALDILRIIKARMTYPGVRQVVASLNAVIYYIAMYIMINPEYHRWMGLTTLIIGLVYFATILLVKRRLSGDAMVMPRYILTAIALLFIATSIQFKDFKTVTFWSIEAFLLIWCAMRWQLKYVWITALGLFVVAIIKLFVTPGAFEYEPIDHFNLILNNRMMAFAAVAVALGFSAVLFSRLSNTAGVIIRVMLHYSWIIIAFILCTVETRDYFQKIMIDSKNVPYLELIGALTFPVVWMLYSLPLVWLGLKKNLAPLLHCGFIVLMLAVCWGGIRGIIFEPLDQFTLLLNVRAGILMGLLIGLVVHIWFLTRQKDRYQIITQILYYAWCVLLFILCTFELNDYFRNNYNSLDFTHLMSFPAVWVFYSLLMVWGGLRKYTRPLIYSGLAALILAIGWGIIQGLSFEPLNRFALITNTRAIIMAFMLIGIALQAWMFKRAHQSYNWHKTMGYLLCLGWSIVLFVLCTVEANDYFRAILTKTDATDTEYYSFARYLVLSIVWVVYSLPLVWYGLKKRITAVAYPAFIAMMLAIIFAVFRGFTFEPITRFNLILNVRALALAVVVIGTIIHTVFLNRKRLDYSWAGKVIGIVHIVIVFMIWELLTVETKDYFSRLIADVWSRDNQGGANDVSRLTDLRQLILSGVWLSYSIILMGIGIWRRKQWLRIMSIILFGITILKIFIFDLSFLDRLYRIFSFMGLGLILLLVSYLYHRFKSVIFDGGTKKG